MPSPALAVPTFTVVVDNTSLATVSDLAAVSDLAHAAPDFFTSTEQPINDFALSQAQDAMRAISQGGVMRPSGLRLKGSMVERFSEGKSGEIFQVSPWLIEIEEGFNSRDFSTADNQKAVIELAEKIDKTGQLMPCVVRWDGGRIVLVDGERRLRAQRYRINVMGRAVETIPVTTLPKLAKTTPAELKFMQLEFNSGKSFTPFEVAANYQDLLKLGWTEQMIADRRGISRTRVMTLLTMAAEATDTIREMVIEDRIAGKTASAIMSRTPNAQAAERVMLKAQEIAQARGRTKVLPKDVALLSDPVSKVAVGGAAHGGRNRTPEIRTILSRARFLELNEVRAVRPGALGKLYIEVSEIDADTLRQLLDI